MLLDIYTTIGRSKLDSSLLHQMVHRLVQEKILQKKTTVEKNVI